MKKTLLVLMMLLASAVLLADAELITTGFSGGYSSRYGLGSMGANCSYQYLADVGPNANVGFTSNFDICLHFGTNQVPVGIGAFLGVGAEFRLSQRSCILLGAGPAAYIEAGKTYAFTGFGPAGSLALTYYFDSDSSFGITFGANVYGQLLTYDRDEIRQPMAVYANGFAGFTFRFEDAYSPSIPLSTALLLY